LDAPVLIAGRDLLIQSFRRRREERERDDDPRTCRATPKPKPVDARAGRAPYKVLDAPILTAGRDLLIFRDTSHTRKRLPLGPYSRPVRRAIW